MKVKDIIDSKYEIKEKLGKGLFWVIEINLMTPFLIKEIELPPDGDVSEILSVLEELRKVNHRLFPKIVEIIKEETSVLVVMENVSGCCAAELGKEKRRPEMVINHTLELCEGLKYFSSLPICEKISWGLSSKDVFIDGSRVCLQNFSIVQKKNLQKEQEAVILYVKEMLAESLKKMKKLNQSIEGYLQGENSYSDYSEIAEELERQLMDYNKTKKRNKLLVKTGVAAVIVLSFGIGAWKGISIVKSGDDTQAASASSASTDININSTKEPEKTKADSDSKKVEKTDNPKPQATKKSSTPEPTNTPERQENTAKSTPDIENTESIAVRTKTPAVQPKQPSQQSSSSQSQRKETVKKRLPATKKPEKKADKPQKQNTLEINIEEESNMEIQVKE
ncbi:MAG: hypothetical protein HFJ09_12190 [Lachnospiraceae bacterium]|nr:hypothetical protein [Lachnospiraceae bacterium]